MEKEELIPTQQLGQQTDAHEEIKYNSSSEAKLAYPGVVARLLDINNWYRNSTLPASRFSLFDSRGTLLDRTVRQGDYIRIDIPGPGTSRGQGYDWVHIESMERFSDESSDVDFTLFVARPSKVPGTASHQVAHFFSDRATSTFIVFRRGNLLSAEVHGRNELPNTKNMDMLDQARNLLVNGGSAAGMSFAQWHILISGILNGAA